MYKIEDKDTFVKNNTRQDFTEYYSVDGYSLKYLKGGLDIIFSAAALLVSAPLTLLISLLVKLDSRGPVIYKQKRCSQWGKTFWIYKFRTMPVGSEDGMPVWAKENDPRSTKIGFFLRHWHLDELPQLINVLKGEMSLVGPRPERPHFVNKFKKAIPGYESRHNVKSGITGWAQVNGYRGDTSIKERVKYDRFYVENWSLLLDIKILFKTVFARKKLWIQPLTFSQSDSCLKNNPSKTPNKKA